jgi:hypothetical protein
MSSFKKTLNDRLKQGGLVESSKFGPFRPAIQKIKGQKTHPCG